MTMELEEELVELYRRYEPHIADHLRASEAARWHELVFSILYRFYPSEPERLRRFVDLMADAELLRVDQLATGEAHSGDTRVLTALFSRIGMSDVEADNAVQLISSVANVIERDYQGKLQRLLRRYGEMMRDELVSAVCLEAGIEGEGEQVVGAMVTHWIQNVTSLPVWAAGPHVEAFSSARAIDPTEIVIAADGLDFNLTMVDDLIAAHNEAELATPETKP